MLEAEVDAPERFGRAIGLADAFDDQVAQGTSLRNGPCLRHGFETAPDRRVGLIP